MSIPFSDLPSDIKREFYYAASKGEWTSEEAYGHLIPEHLRDNPDEIRAFMNGGTFSKEVWVPSGEQVQECFRLTPSFCISIQVLVELEHQGDCRL